MRNSHLNNRILRRFIRESLTNKGVLSEQSLGLPTEIWKQGAATLLNWLVPPAGLGSDTDPCANFWMYMTEEENKKHGHFVFGLVLSGLGIAGGVKAASSLFAGAWRAASVGKYIGALARAAGGVLLGAGVVVTADQTYELAFLTLSDKKTLEENGILSDFDRNRRISKILGNLYIGAALGPWVGSRLTGKQVIKVLSNSSNLSNFKTALFESYAFLSNNTAAMIVNTIIGSRFETFYANGALDGISNLDQNMLYQINDDFAKILVNQISRGFPGENVTFTATEAYKHWLIATLQQMCAENKPRNEIQPYYDQFLQIKRASG